jgi:hypothetical protein
MKSLQEFKSIVEEESDYSKFDVLVRAGLGNKAQIQRLHKILGKMEEEKPNFSPADRAIIQNIFNKMVDVITNNKQIFTQARRAVREDLDEGVLATSDYKIDSAGHKYKAHRIKVGQDAPEIGDDSDKIKEEIEIVETDNVMKGDPPVTLLLKRKAIRLYPDETKIALYYNEKLKKYFSVAYSNEKHIEASSIQAEEVELEEAVMDTLHKIVSNKSASSVKFASGQTRKVDHFTASALTQVHNALNDQNKKKFADMVHKSPGHFQKAADFAFKRAK